MSAERESLAQRVRRVQRETGCFDPGELSEKVLATFSSPEEMIAALGEALPLFVRVTVIGERREALSGKPGRGSRTAATRDHYQRIVSQGVDVSGGKGQWKALRECTRDDLLVVIEHRRQLAAANLRTAEVYERLLKFMPKKDMTVGDVAPDLVLGVFGGAE